MEANKIGCRMCGGTSFTKTDKIAKCDYCGSEFDLTELQARAAKLEAEQKTLGSLANDVSHLRQLADQKEAERQKAIEEEKRRQEEAQKAYEEHNKAGKKGCCCAVLISITMPFFFQVLHESDLSNETCAILGASFIAVWVILPLIIAITQMRNNK